MKDWKTKLDAFLTFNQRNILDNPGKVSHAVAEALALQEYDKYNQQRLLEDAKEIEQDSNVKELTDKTRKIKRQIKRI